ncbi:Protein NDRG1, partial [Trichinella sp. T6]
LLPTEKTMDDVELGKLELSPAALLITGVESHKDYEEVRVDTAFGKVSVYVVGDGKKPAIVTFHDLGLSANPCFQSFFHFSEMSVISEKFCVYHINAPGQEEDAEPLPENYIYPTMDELAVVVENVVDHFKLKTFIGFGVGVGANVLARYALKNAKRVDALILVNCVCTAPGWIEWGYQKANIYYLKNRGMTSLTIDYLMWHHFGRNLDQYSSDLVSSYKQYFTRLHNPRNLAAFIMSYLRRTDLNIRREGPTIECPVLQIVGSGSPHINDTVELNSKLDPTKSNWMKVSDSSGLVLEEKPEKVTEAILLFLQGEGHLPSLSYLKWRQSRSESICQTRSNSICVKEPESSQVQGRTEVIFENETSKEAFAAA